MMVSRSPLGVGRGQRDQGFASRQGNIKGRDEAMATHATHSCAGRALCPPPRFEIESASVATRQAQTQRRPKKQWHTPSSSFWGEISGSSTITAEDGPTLLDPPLLEPPAPELDPPAEDEKPILLSCERPKFKKVKILIFHP